MKASELSVEQSRILEMANGLADVFGRNAESLDREGRFSTEHYRLAHAAGYMRLTLPNEYGGLGADPYTFVLAQEALARGCAGSALAICMHLCLQANLSFMLNKEQKDRYLAEAGNRPVTFAGGGTEQETGGSWNSLKASARRVEDGYLLNGRKRFVSGAQSADYFYSFLGMEQSKQTDLVADVCAFIMPRSTPGISVDVTWNSMGMRASGSDDLVLKDVRLPEDALVGRPGLGFQQAAKYLFYFLFGETATYVGVALTALDEAAAYIRKRHQKYAGNRIAPRYEQQLLIGEMTMRLESARAFLHQEARHFSDPDVRRHGYTLKSLARAAMAKHTATRASIWVVDQAMEIFGGFGFLREGPMERHYRDVRGGPFHPPRNLSTALSLAGQYKLGLNLDPNLSNTFQIPSEEESKAAE